MEGFCRGCLLQFIEPSDLIQYTERNRRLFVYSTGIQVKRNDSFTFQLCKECYFNMKQSCKFKKQCRSSEKKFKNYLILKEDGGDFESFIKNIDGNVSLRLPFTSGNSTPVHQNNKDDDNESTCTSIRNFMTDILEGEEMPPTEARIIREVIEEEADVLDDSLDSHWLQDDLTIGSEYDGVFGTSPFGTPRSTHNNVFYTPRSIDEAKQRQINYLTSKEIIEKIDKPRISQKFDMPLLENMDIEDEESRPVHKTEIDEFSKDEDVKSNAPDLHEFDNSIPSEVEDMVTENSISSTLHCFKTDLLKDLAVKKQMDILENDKSSFDTYNKNIASTKVSSDNTVTNPASTDDMCIILSQGTTEKKVDVPLTYELEYYVNKAELKKQITSLTVKKEYHCMIDRNLDIALKNVENKEFSLDQLIVSPAVSIRSGVSTPTINNILFGDRDTETQPSTSTPIRNYLFEGKHDTEIVPKYFPQLGQNIEDFDDDKSDIKLDDYLNNEYNKTDDECDIKIKLESNTEFDTNVVPKQEVIDTQIESDPNIVLEEFLREAENSSLELNEEMIPEIIDPQILSNALSDQDLFKRPLTPPSDNYDFDNCICRVCDKKFTACKSLKIHIAKKHKHLFPNTDKHRNKSHKLKVQICNVCGKDIKWGSSNFKRHLMSHQKKEVNFFYCNDCPLFYKSRSALVTHLREHYKSGPVWGKEHKKFLCNLCGKVSKSSSHHKLHLKRHLKDHSITCIICNKGFYNNYDLKQHIRIKHYGELPYECKLCHKRYKRQESVTRHMKQHLGKFDYKCDVCNVEYVSKSGLAQHYVSLKCIANRKKMKSQKLKNIKVTVGKGSIELIKAKTLIETEEIMKIEIEESIENVAEIEESEENYAEIKESVENYAEINESVENYAEIKDRVENAA